MDDERNNELRDDEMRTQLRALPRVCLSADDRSAIWAQVDAALDNRSRRPYSRPWRTASAGRRAMTALAAVAGVVAAAGVYVGIEHYGHSPAPATKVSTALPPIPATQLQAGTLPSPPFEVVGKEWRVVVMNSQLRAGSDATLELYYVGQKTAHHISWQGVGQFGTVQPDKIATLAPDYPFPNGLASERMTITWVEGGKHKTETIDFAHDPVQPLNIQRGSTMVGAKAGWTVQYAGEQAGDASFTATSQAELFVIYHGTNVPPHAKVHFNLSEASGPYTLGTYTFDAWGADVAANGSVPASGMITTLGSKQSDLLQSNHATMTITWPGHTVTIPMSPPKPKPGLNPITSAAAEDNHYYAAQVGKAFGDVHAKVASVAPFTDNVNGQTDRYTVTLYGNFRKGSVGAARITYEVSADGMHLWNIAGYDASGAVVWIDTKLPVGK